MDSQRHNSNQNQVRQITTLPQSVITMKHQQQIVGGKENMEQNPPPPGTSSLTGNNAKHSKITTISVTNKIAHHSGGGASSQLKQASQAGRQNANSTTRPSVQRQHKIQGISQNNARATSQIRRAPGGPSTGYGDLNANRLENHQVNPTKNLFGAFEAGTITQHLQNQINISRATHQNRQGGNKLNNTASKVNYYPSQQQPQTRFETIQGNSNHTKKGVGIGVGGGPLLSSGNGVDLVQKTTANQSNINSNNLNTLGETHTKLRSAFKDGIIRHQSSSRANSRYASRPRERFNQTQNNAVQGSGVAGNSATGVNGAIPQQAFRTNVASMRTTDQGGLISGQGPDFYKKQSTNAANQLQAAMLSGYHQYTGLLKTLGSLDNLQTVDMQRDRSTGRGGMSLGGAINSNNHHGSTSNHSKAKFKRNGRSLRNIGAGSTSNNHPNSNQYNHGGNSNHPMQIRSNQQQNHTNTNQQQQRAYADSKMSSQRNTATNTTKQTFQQRVLPKKDAILIQQALIPGQNLKTQNLNQRQVNAAIQQNFLSLDEIGMHPNGPTFDIDSEEEIIHPSNLRTMALSSEQIQHILPVQQNKVNQHQLIPNSNTSGLSSPSQAMSYFTNNNFNSDKQRGQGQNQANQRKTGIQNQTTSALDGKMGQQTKIQSNARSALRVQGADHFSQSSLQMQGVQSNVYGGAVGINHNTGEQGRRTVITNVDFQTAPVNSKLGRVGAPQSPTGGVKKVSEANRRKIQTTTGLLQGGGESVEAEEEDIARKVTQIASEVHNQTLHEASFEHVKTPDSTTHFEQLNNVFSMVELSNKNTAITSHRKQAAESRSRGGNRSKNHTKQLVGPHQMMATTTFYPSSQTSQGIYARNHPQPTTQQMLVNSNQNPHHIPIPASNNKNGLQVSAVNVQQTTTTYTRGGSKSRQGSRVTTTGGGTNPNLNLYQPPSSQQQTGRSGGNGGSSVGRGAKIASTYGADQGAGNWHKNTVKLLKQRQNVNKINQHTVINKNQGNTFVASSPTSATADKNTLQQNRQQNLNVAFNKNGLISDEIKVNSNRRIDVHSNSPLKLGNKTNSSAINGSSTLGSSGLNSKMENNFGQKIHVIPREKVKKVTKHNIKSDNSSSTRQHRDRGYSNGGATNSNQVQPTQNTDLPAAPSNFNEQDHTSQQMLNSDMKQQNGSKQSTNQQQNQPSQGASSKNQTVGLHVKEGVWLNNHNGLGSYGKKKKTKDEVVSRLSMRGHQLFTKLDFKPTQGQNLRYSQADGGANKDGLTFSNSWEDDNDTAFDEERRVNKAANEDQDSASRMTDMTAPNSQKVHHQPHAENKLLKRTVTMWTEIDSSEAGVNEGVTAGSGGEQQNSNGENSKQNVLLSYQRPGTMKPIRMIIAEEVEPVDEVDDQNHNATTSAKKDEPSLAKQIQFNPKVVEP